ncbi:MAG: hypothetical protein ACRD4R_00930 [Candidatus Acidiferrales bacterium]
MAVSFPILMAGNPSSTTAAMLFRLAARGWGARRAQTLAEAKELMATFQFVAVLAPENLPDGRGYDLAALVAKQSGNLYVGIALSETLWLPVIEGGGLVLGQRALNASVFENEVELALGQVGGGDTRVAENRKVEARPVAPHRIAPLKRRGAAAA